MSDPRIPMKSAIEQVAEQLGLPESKIAEYARRMVLQKGRQGAPIVNVHAGLGEAIKAARELEERKAREQAEASLYGRLYKQAYPDGDALESIRRMLGGVQLAAKRVEAMGGAPALLSVEPPAQPANRRTFRVLGKPYYFLQTKKGLQLRKGEAPWT